jgi:hypothetical protein
MSFHLNVTADIGKSTNKSIQEMLISKLVEGILCLSDMNVCDNGDDGASIFIESSDENPFTLDVFVDTDMFATLVFINEEKET